MKYRRRWWLVAVGFVVLLFGQGCLNYTKAESREHHLQQAQRYNLPPPSYTIYLLGITCAPLGGGLLGFGLAPRPVPPSGVGGAST
jgi:hypothetical protein